MTLPRRDERTLLTWRHKSQGEVGDTLSRTQCQQCQIQSSFLEWFCIEGRGAIFPRSLGPGGVGGCCGVWSFYRVSRSSSPLPLIAGKVQKNYFCERE